MARQTQTVSPQVQDRQTASSSRSPCAGKCSTVFGDTVCRGCRRFQHEVIHWNRYSPAQRQQVWQRLDQQLDQIVLPRTSGLDSSAISQFLQVHPLSLPPGASRGRQVYEVLRQLQRHAGWLAASGLNLTPGQLDALLVQIEHGLIALGKASFELAWQHAPDSRAP